MPLMWTPKGADPLLTAIPLKEATDLTMREYMGRLSIRIAKLADQDEPGILAEAEVENLRLEGLDPYQVGDMLAEESEYLTMAVTTGGQEFPVRAVPKPMEEIEMTLGEFLNRLYLHY